MREVLASLLSLKPLPGEDHGKKKKEVVTIYCFAVGDSGLSCMGKPGKFVKGGLHPSQA